MEKDLSDVLNENNVCEMLPHFDSVGNVYYVCSHCGASIWAPDIICHNCLYVVENIGEVYYDD